MTSFTPTRPRRKLLALLLLPVLLVLAGCMKLDISVDIKSEDDADLRMEMVDSMGFLELEEQGCEDNSPSGSDVTIEEFRDDDGAFGCRYAGNISGSIDEDGFTITTDGDEFVFRMGTIDTGLTEDDEFDPDDPMMAAFTPDISISVTFPGKVTYASEGGVIDGSTVTWTGFEALVTRIEARGEASGGLFGGMFGGGSSDDDEAVEEEQPTQDPEADEATGSEDTTTEDGATTDDEAAVTPAATEGGEDSSSGLPTWVIVLLGVLLLLVIFLIVLLARRQKSSSAAEAQGAHQAAGAYPQQYQQQQQPGAYPQQQYPAQYQGGQQQWDQTQQMPGQHPPQQQWDQSQQQWHQGNNGGQPPQQ